MLLGTHANLFLLQVSCEHDTVLVATDLVLCSSGLWLPQFLELNFMRLAARRRLTGGAFVAIDFNLVALISLSVRVENVFVREIWVEGG